MKKKIFIFISIFGILITLLSTNKVSANNTKKLVIFDNNNITNIQFSQSGIDVSNYLLSAEDRLNFKLNFYSGGSNFSGAFWSNNIRLYSANSYAFGNELVITSLKSENKMKRIIISCTGGTSFLTKGDGIIENYGTDAITSGTKSNWTYSLPSLMSVLGIKNGTLPSGQINISYLAIEYEVTDVDILFSDLLFIISGDLFVNEGDYLYDVSYGHQEVIMSMYINFVDSRRYYLTASLLDYEDPSNEYYYWRSETFEYSEETRYLIIDYYNKADYFSDYTIYEATSLLNYLYGDYYLSYNDYYEINAYMAFTFNSNRYESTLYDLSTIDLYYQTKDFEQGYLDGHSDGYVEGYEEGLNNGYESGQNDGYEDGYSVGINEGYAQGFTKGEADGYKDKEVLEGFFPSILGGILQFILTLLSIDILGFNLGYFVMLLASGAIIFIVIKTIL